MHPVLNRTFNLPNKSVYTGKVIGSGLSLGLTTGDGNNYGFYQTNSAGTSTAKEAYNRSLPSSGGNSTAVGYDKVIGISTDPTKSGIIVETDADLVVCIRF